MQVEYRKEYSHNLGREMEFKRYGHAGKPVLVFPSQDGDCNQYEEFGMVDVLSDYIEQGRLQLFCVGSVDKECVLILYYLEAVHLPMHLVQYI